MVEAEGGIRDCCRTLGLGDVDKGELEVAATSGSKPGRPAMPAAQEGPGLVSGKEPVEVISSSSWEGVGGVGSIGVVLGTPPNSCPLYTSDAAYDLHVVALGRLRAHY